MAANTGNLPMRLLRQKLHKRNLKIRQRNLARQKTGDALAAGQTGEKGRRAVAIALWALGGGGGVYVGLEGKTDAGERPARADSSL